MINNKSEVNYFSRIKMILLLLLIFVVFVPQCISLGIRMNCFNLNDPISNRGMSNHQMIGASTSSMIREAEKKNNAVSQNILTQSLYLYHQNFVRNAVQKVGPSVVRIDCEREISPMMAFFSDQFQEGTLVKVSGSGIIIEEDGSILTNAHVVNQAKKLTVTLSNGRTLKANVIALDEFTDLAVLKIDTSKFQNIPIKKATLGDSSKVTTGDWSIAVGCPVGLDFTVTVGVVSHPQRSAFEIGATHLKGNYIQTDAALNSGNSGGPLVNHEGEVIGINTMVRSNTEAIGFAIPINKAKDIYNILKQGIKPTHAFFGMEVNSLTPDKAMINNEDPNLSQLPEIHGAVINKIQPGSPAEASGLRRNDVIVAVNGFEILSAHDAENILDICKPNELSTISIKRGEQGIQFDFQAKPQNLYELFEEKRKQSPILVIKPPK